jgi:F420-dependent oxidoreductase-like protein
MPAVLLSAKLAPCFPYAQLVEFWRAADDLGFHGVWNYDHFYGLADLSQPTLEGWTTLAAMGAIVKRARIGCMVTGVTYRHPAVLANMATSIDHISGGRLEFGLGAAWHEAEHRGYGLEFPSPGTRIDMLDEALTVIKLLWTQGSASFEGRFFRLDEALCEPKPVQQPHPPIVVGGGGRRKTLRVVAKHADEWNAPGFSAADWGDLNRALDEHCTSVGREPKEIRRSVQIFIYPQQEGQPEEQLSTLNAYEDAGCQHAVLSFYSPPAPALLERCAPR